MTASDPEILELAHQALRTAAAGVPERAWSWPTPCEQWNVAQVLRHAAGDQLAYAAAITGSAGPAENPFDPAPEPPGNPARVLDDALAAASGAFAQVNGAAEVPTPLPMGALPRRFAFGAAALDAAVHAWDIAVATGQASPLSSALARQLTPTAQLVAEPLRGFAYAAALPAQPGDDPATSLLRYLGRDPRCPVPSVSS